MKQENISEAREMSKREVMHGNENDISVHTGNISREVT